jgi:hypothetical protein
VRDLAREARGEVVRNRGRDKVPYRRPNIKVNYVKFRHDAEDGRGELELCLGAAVCLCPNVSRLCYSFVHGLELSDSAECSRT